MDGGTAQFDLGRCSDVMTGLPKTRGAMMLLRGFNPQIIAMDEISREKDLEAVRQIAGCGVGILASVHGADLSELKKRPAYRSMLEEGVFHYLLRVDRMGQVRRYALERIGS
jgi:stage III sporulation protein AA